eukprot:SM000366S13819  [mRNA]  locus=s366:71402:72667:+ [translate_table: standard]
MFFKYQTAGSRDNLWPASHCVVASGLLCEAHEYMLLNRPYQTASVLDTSCWVLKVSGSWVLRNLRDKGRSAPSTEEAKEGARMLRVRNMHDLVPKVPLGVDSGLVVGPMFSHGGFEVLRNAYDVEEYRRSSPAPFIGKVPWVYLGAATAWRSVLSLDLVDARMLLALALQERDQSSQLLSMSSRRQQPHLVYLAMIDPTRDPALMNKTNDVLEVEHRVPPCWFSPTRHLGLYWEVARWHRRL